MLDYKELCKAGGRNELRLAALQNDVEIEMSDSNQYQTVTYYEGLRLRYLKELSDYKRYPNYVKPTPCYVEEDHNNQEEVPCSDDSSMQWMFARYFLSCSSEEMKDRFGAATLEFMYKMLRADGAERFKSLRIFWLQQTEVSLHHCLNDQKIQFLCSFYSITYEYLLFFLTSDVMLSWCAEWESLNNKLFAEVVVNGNASYTFRKQFGATCNEEDSVYAMFSKMTNYDQTNLWKLHNNKLSRALIETPSEANQTINLPDLNPLKKRVLNDSIVCNKTASDLLGEEDLDADEDEYLED